MCPQVGSSQIWKKGSSIFLFEDGPKFRALENGKVILEVDPGRSKVYKIAYSVLFALYGIPAKIVYKGPGREPKDVDHLEYYPTYRDFMFLRNFKRIIPKLRDDDGLANLMDLLEAFYGKKMENLREYFEVWVLPKFNSNYSFNQSQKVVVV